MTDTLTTTRTMRQNAISDLLQAALGDGRDLYTGPVLQTREQVSAAVDALHDLGSTSTWHRSLTVWRNYVDNPNRDLRWTVLQGSVHACMSA